MLASVKVRLQLLFVDFHFSTSKMSWHPESLLTRFPIGHRRQWIHRAHRSFLSNELDDFRYRNYQLRSERECLEY